MKKFRRVGKDSIKCASNALSYSGVCATRI
jgi:hypothetical protein